MDARTMAVAAERERIRTLSRWRDVGETVATLPLPREEWPVRVRQLEGIYARPVNASIEISGRGSAMHVHVARTALGLLVAIPNTNTCGFVPEDCSGRDIQHYCRLKNGVDAETVAAGVRLLIDKGLV